MDLSQYAELFRTETRDHLTTLNRLLLEWEQHPESPEPVAGIFRAVHTIKGMAGTMGYARVAELELLFRTADALEELVTASVGGREQSVDVTPLLEALDGAAAPGGPGGEA